MLHGKQFGSETDPRVDLLALSEAEHGPVLSLVRSPVVVLVDNAVVFTNPSLEDLLGKTRAELRGAGPSDLLHEDDVKKVTRWLEDGDVSEFRADLRLVTGSERHRWANAHLVDALWNGRRATVGFLVDMEDARRSKKVEEQLLQAQKMEAVGRLAGGIAHDMNNMLGAIMGFASVLQAELEPDSRTRTDVDHILEACKKGRDVMLNLLGFARKGKYRMERFSLKDRIEDIVELLKHTIPKTILIVTDMPENPLEIHGDPTQIHHAVMNICLNAVDAMEESGTLTIRADAFHLKDPIDSRYPELDPGMYARLVVSDTGTGMNRDTVEMAFEPFFTTKPVGKGSGLGLPMVYGTVKNHGGAVIIESAPDAGTDVVLLLPTGASPSQSLITLNGRKTPSNPSMNTILLVDDEPMIRNAGVRLLEKLGYRVLLASDGKEALRVFSENKDLITVILLDLVMPVMSGAETLVKLREIDPDIPIVLCSGYTKEEGAEDLIGKGADAFIQKPFGMDALKWSLSSVLED